MATEQLIPYNAEAIPPDDARAIEIAWRGGLFFGARGDLLRRAVHQHHADVE